MSIPLQIEQYECQLNLTNRLEHFIQKEFHEGDEESGSIDQTYHEGLVLEGVIATVDWFDAEKGFGFVDVEGLDGKVFLHSQQLHESGIDLVSDSDDLLCDIGRNAKGPYITKVHDIEVDLDVVETSDCRIIRVFHDRVYGFVQIADSSRDAFFHFSVVPSADRNKLKVGTKIKCQIKADKRGHGLQIKKIIEFLESES